MTGDRLWHEPVLESATMHAPPQATGPFRTPIRVRYQETDAAGVVYYSNYFVYFEVARVESLRAVGMPITEVERRGVILPAVSANCTYHSPAHVDDLLEVAMWTEHVGRASFGFGYEVRRVAEGGAGPAPSGDADPAPGGAAIVAGAAAAGDADPTPGAGAPAPGELIASGSTRHAVVSRETMRPVRIEGWIAELVARAQEWRPPS
jgi:YbgC/YbaW family acyl-CoA thioester hydrolase